ncbi:O-antigen ligase family protein [Paenibacillus cisolokensis]|uniref:O-antigen ligase family protein n=1 Tax=Paenibacillus cisolokensis TaxID=1658519 RepID=UPI003D26BA14
MITEMRIERKNVSLTFMFLVLFLWISSLLDFPRNFYIAGASLSSLLSIAIVGAVWLLITKKPKFPHGTNVMWWFGFMLIWGWITFLWYPPDKQSIQNISVLIAFIGVTLITARETTENEETAQKLMDTFLKCSVFTLTLYTGVTVVFDDASRDIIFPRGFAIFALLIVSVALGNNRYKHRKRYFLLAILTIVIIALSLSRTAILISLLLIPLSQIKFNVRGIVRIFLWLLITSSVFYYAVNHIGVIKNRFFIGDMSLNVGGISINAMGRMIIWEYTLESFEKSPILGSGVGSIESVLDAYFENINQPHNDYLRIIHDYGIIGIFMFSIGVLGLIIVISNAWLKAEKNNQDDANYHLSALLSLVSVLSLMVTDNPFVYMFVMVPLGILLGISLGKINRREYKRLDNFVRM